MFFMNCIRPDIYYVVSKLSRYTHNPGKDHQGTLNRLLRYLNDTTDWGLHYVGYPKVLEGYYDAKWVTGDKEVNSTSGCVYIMW